MSDGISAMYDDHDSYVELCRKMGVNYLSLESIGWHNHWIVLRQLKAGEAMENIPVRFEFGPEYLPKVK